MGYFVRVEARQAGKTARQLETLKFEWIAGFLMEVAKANPTVRPAVALQWAQDNGHLPKGAEAITLEIKLGANLDLGKLYALSQPTAP